MPVYDVMIMWTATVRGTKYMTVKANNLEDAKLLADNDSDVDVGEYDKIIDYDEKISVGEN